jgi:hypothetical protein
MLNHGTCTLAMGTGCLSVSTTREAADKFIAPDYQPLYKSFKVVYDKVIKCWINIESVVNQASTCGLCWGQICCQCHSCYGYVLQVWLSPSVASSLTRTALGHVLLDWLSWQF